MSAHIGHPTMLQLPVLHVTVGAIRVVFEMPHGV